VENPRVNEAASFGSVGGCKPFLTERGLRIDFTSTFFEFEKITFGFSCIHTALDTEELAREFHSPRI